jgi:hypothetical protein
MTALLVLSIEFPTIRAVLKLQAGRLVFEANRLRTSEDQIQDSLYHGRLASEEAAPQDPTSPSASRIANGVE